MRCANCGKDFKKFRNKDPFSETCKNCIKRAWHIPMERRKKYITGKRQLKLEIFE